MTLYDTMVKERTKIYIEITIKDYFIFVDKDVAGEPYISVYKVIWRLVGDC